MASQASASYAAAPSGQSSRTAFAARTTFNSDVGGLLVCASDPDEAQQKERMMTNVRRLILLGGVILLAAGVIGLFVPVAISGGIGCGNAVHSDLSAARQQDDHNVGNSPVVQQIPIANQLAPKSEFVSSCNSALGNRRLWTIPLALVGLAGIGWAVAQGRDKSAAGI
jgi:hypothetical protein